MKMDGENSTRVPSGSRGISGSPSGTSGVRTPRKPTSKSVKYCGAYDSRPDNSDRNQSAR